MLKRDLLDPSILDPVIGGWKTVYEIEPCAPEEPPVVSLLGRIADVEADVKTLTNMGRLVSYGVSEDGHEASALVIGADVPDACAAAVHIPSVFLEEFNTSGHLHVHQLTALGRNTRLATGQRGMHENRPVWHAYVRLSELLFDEEGFVRTSGRDRTNVSVMLARDDCARTTIGWDLTIPFRVCSIPPVFGSRITRVSATDRFFLEAAVSDDQLSIVGAQQVRSCLKDRGFTPYVRPFLSGIEELSAGVGDRRTLFVTQLTGGRRTFVPSQINYASGQIQIATDHDRTVDASEMCVDGGIVRATSRQIALVSRRDPSGAMRVIPTRDAPLPIRDAIFRAYMPTLADSSAPRTATP